MLVSAAPTADHNWRTTFLTASGGGLDLQQLLRFTVEESDSEIGMNPAILFAALFSWVHPSQNRTVRSLREPTRQFLIIRSPQGNAGLLALKAHSSLFGCPP